MTMSQDVTKGMSKELRQLARKATKQNWTLVKTRNNHYKWVPPQKDGTPIFSSCSNSDVRALKNLQAHLRKEGLVL